MTEPTTTAGRDLVRRIWDGWHPSRSEQNEAEFAAIVLAIEEQARAEGRREADEWWATRFAAGYKSDGSGMRPYMDMTIRAEDYFDQHVEGGWPLPRIDRNDPRLVARHGRSSDPEPAPRRYGLRDVAINDADGKPICCCECGCEKPRPPHWDRCGDCVSIRGLHRAAIPALQATGEPRDE